MSVSTVCFGFSLFNAQLNYLNIFKVRKAKFNFDPWSFLFFFIILLRALQCTWHRVEGHQCHLDSAYNAS